MNERPGRAWRGALVSVSLANLLALQAWLMLFRPGQEAPLPGIDFAAAILAVLLLAAFLWLADQAAGFLPERPRRSLRTAGLAAAWILVVWAAAKPSLQQWLQYALGTRRAWVLGAASGLGVLLTVLLWRDTRRSVRWMGMAALVLAPYVLLNFLHAGWQAWARGVTSAPEARPPVPLLTPGEHRPRTVILLFDEFDYELAFDPRVRLRPLPALDGLRSQSLFATNAYPPMHSTAMSVPAMLTGHLVREGKLSDDHPGDLLLQLYPDGQDLFSARDTVFSDLRARGLTSLRMNDALLPPARLPGNADADVVVPPAPDHLRTLWDHVAGHLIDISTLLPFAKAYALETRLGEALHVPPASAHVAQVADEMVDLAGDGKADVLFLHILLPHLPVVFDPVTQAFSPNASADYRDNLVGVDQVVGRVLARLKERDRLDDTELIVVSDHFFRLKRAKFGLGDHRIPFLARFGRDRQPVGTFDKPFNTVLFREMVRVIATGDVRDSAALGRWLQAHATFGESPLTEYRKGW